MSQLNQQPAAQNRFESSAPPTLQPNKLAASSTATAAANKLKSIKTTTNGITLINSSTPSTNRQQQTGQKGAHQSHMGNLNMNNANAVRIKLEQQQQQLGNLIAAVAAAGNKSMAVRLNGDSDLTAAADESGDKSASTPASSIAALAASIQPTPSNVCLFLHFYQLILVLFDNLLHTIK